MSLSVGNSTFKLPPKQPNPFNQSNSSHQTDSNISVLKQQMINQQPGPVSKLHQYFASSQFLSSQEELSVFIENFPIIDIESSHRSINDILPLLIRQNQLLGKKCQSQVLLIKESFSKHQAINKQNKKVKEEIEQVQAQCRELIKQQQTETIEALKGGDQLRGKLKVYEELIKSQNGLMRELISGEYKKCQEMTNSRTIRIAYDEFMTFRSNNNNNGNSSPFYQLQQRLNLKQQKPEHKSSIEQSSSNSQNMQNTYLIQKLVTLQQIERYCKDQRRRNKYYGRVKSSVEEFCIRLIKITTVVPIDIVTQELSHQCGQFMDIIGELINSGEGNTNNKRKRQDSNSAVAANSNNNNTKKDKNTSRDSNRDRARERQRQRSSKDGGNRQKQRDKSRESKLNNVNSASSLMSKSELQSPIYGSSSYNPSNRFEFMNSTNNQNRHLQPNQLRANQLQTNINNNSNNNNNHAIMNIIRDKQSTIMVRHHNQSSFEGILSTYVNQSTKKYHQTIQSLQTQVQQLKKQLQTSKSYYENYLINAKLQYEQGMREKQQQVTIKDEMCKHFEEELSRCFALKQELENRVLLVTKQNEEMKVRESPLKHQIDQLKQEISHKQQAIAKLLLKQSLIQQSHSQQLTKKQQQLTQITCKLESKLRLKQEQFQAELTKKHLAIKQLQSQLTSTHTELRHHKQLIEDKNIELNRVTKRLQVIEEDQVKRLQHQVETIQHQITNTKVTNGQLANTIKELQQEQALNTTYIQELQSKSLKQLQAIQKLNKKLSQAQIQNKSLKLLQATNSKLESQLQLSNVEIKKTHQDNSSLKKLVKQMKKQLEQVYKTINELKSIEKDRERLVLESQKSQRWKEQIMKDYDQMKYEILQVQAENKSLALELRHYKNALKRIEMIH